MVREDAIALYGFVDAAERDWFRLLTTVQGVGARVALRPVVLSPDEIAQAIAADKRDAGRPAGVGPKLAARLASELKDKGRLGWRPGGARRRGRRRAGRVGATTTRSPPWSISAKPPEAFGAVARVTRGSAPSAARSA